MDRVHRIGQTRPVLGIRLCSAFDSAAASPGMVMTVEERMRQISRQRALLGDAVIHRKRFASLLSMEVDDEGAMLDEGDLLRELGKPITRRKRADQPQPVSSLVGTPLEPILKDRSPSAYKEPSQIAHQLELE